MGGSPVLTCKLFLLYFHSRDVITDRIKAFTTQVTSGNQSNEDALLQLQPFMGMDVSLAASPLAVAALGKLNLVATST